MRNARKETAGLVLLHGGDSMVNIVAEIGCNHMGELELALELARAASAAGANIVKFQKRHPASSLTKEQYNSPHPNPEQAFGETYGEHRTNLELTVGQHAQLKLECERLSCAYGCSVFDMPSLKEIVALGTQHIKIPSPANVNGELLRAVCEAASGSLHISLGMTTRTDEDRIMRLIEDYRGLSRVIIYACTSSYPTRPEDACLLEVTRLIGTYGAAAQGIGFSGHHQGIAIDVAAVALGATWIERHFTIDRALKGTDNTLSILPIEMEQLCENVNTVSLALTQKCGKILESEQSAMQKMKVPSTIHKEA